MYIIATQFLQAIVNGTANSFDYAAAQAYQQAYLARGSGSTIDPRTNEDCLFLDVIVPKGVFDNAHSRIKRQQPYSGAGGAPVMVWIYGGGYTGGSKLSQGNPSGLIRASQRTGGQGIIFVALNYRLGALGFLSGPTLQGSGGVANAALYDQRLAIEWVAKYIHLFGGDPKKITIAGESAGGGSVEHQLTAFGGQRGVSFQKAIPQSPAFAASASPAVQENTAQMFLKQLNVSTIAEARQLSSAAVIRANAVMIGGAPYGQYYFGPVSDGVFAPDLPGLLFNAGAFAKDVQIMDGHNTNEAPFFTPPYVKTNSDLAAFFKLNYPGITNTAIEFITTSLYPPRYDGSQPYRSPLERTMAIIADSSFICNRTSLPKFGPGGQEFWASNKGACDSSESLIHLGEAAEFCRPRSALAPVIPVQIRKTNGEQTTTSIELIRIRAMHTNSRCLRLSTASTFR